MSVSNNFIEIFQEATSSGVDDRPETNEKEIGGFPTFFKLTIRS